MNFNGNIDYYNNVSFINASRNVGKHLLYSQSLQLRYMFDDIMEAEFNGNYLLNFAEYKLPFSNKVSAQSYMFSLGSKTYLGDHFTVGLELAQRLNDGFTNAEMNVNPTLINSYIEYTFMSNKQALLRLQGFDLLNQNTGISREIIGNDILDNRNDRLARYFMLTLNIRLQKYPKK